MSWRNRDPMASTGFRLAAAFFAAAFLLKAVTGLKSRSDVGDLLVACVGIVAVSTFIAVPALRVRGRRLAKVVSAFPGSKAWLVNTDLASLVLVVTTSDVYLTTRGGKVRSRWPREQLVRAVIEKADIGWPPRPCLRLEFGRHQAHETIMLAFPTWLGMWTSAPAAQAAKTALQA